MRSSSWGAVEHGGNHGDDHGDASANFALELAAEVGNRKSIVTRSGPRGSLEQPIGPPRGSLEEPLVTRSEPRGPPRGSLEEPLVIRSEPRARPRGSLEEPIGPLEDFREFLSWVVSTKTSCCVTERFPLDRTFPANVLPTPTASRGYTYTCARVCTCVYVCVCCLYTPLTRASTHASVAHGARFVSIAPAAEASEAARESCAVLLVHLGYHIE